MDKKTIFNKLDILLTKRDKGIIGILLFMGLFLSIIETIGISAIMPFISFVSSPELIQTNEYSKIFYDYFSFKDDKEFIVSMGFILIFFYFFRSIYTIFHGYLMIKFAMVKYSVFSNKLFSNYLNMPYSEFVKQNSGTMSKIIITESLYLSYLVQNILIFLSEVFIIILLYILLLMVDIKMTIVLTLLLSLKVIILALTVSKRIKIAGENRTIIHDRYYRIVNEVFGNFKMIKFISNKRSIFKNFTQISDDFKKVYIINNTLQLIPRNVLESVGLSLLVGIVIYTISFEEDYSSIIPILSMYALALYRILPAVSKILSSYNNIMFYMSSLNIVYNNLQKKIVHENENCNIKLKKTIDIKNLFFSYNQKESILNNLNLQIQKGKKIAFIGESGSGKSTLVDLICGIYRPDSGKILIDGVELDNSNIVSWRKRIGYIPQSIYLFDGTIAENISFGRDYDEVKLIKVLKQANIYNFIIQKEGFNTMVGEGGIQLSGGQKQRIGIARALYGDPEILVLDEATSALDSATEKAIMDEIYKVSEGKTLMIIAHRLSTIEKCDIKIDIGELNK